MKCIGSYLKATWDQELILNPSSDVYKLNCYPDADFSGIYGHEIPTDPACVKSRTGFVITFDDCTVYLALKLYTENALAKMESEINDLAHSCRELFPNIGITKSLGQEVGLPIVDTIINISIHDNN